MGRAGNGTTEVHGTVHLNAVIYELKDCDSTSKDFHDTCNVSNDSKCL